MVIGSFAGYSCLVWHLCSLVVYMTSSQDLWAAIVFVELCGVILIGLPLLVNCSFSFTAFNALCFLYFVFLLLCDRRNFFSDLIYLEFVKLPVFSLASLLSVVELGMNPLTNVY